MPQYYFNVQDKFGNFKDRDFKGAAYPSLADACAQALRIATELSQDGEAYVGFIVCVVDQQGSQVATVPV
jgi:hypothetical protein